MKHVLKIILKVFLWLIGVVLLILVSAVLLIRLPSVQNYITHKAAAFVSSKTHTRIGLQRLYIGFPKSIVLEGLFAEDLQHDTLLYLGKLDVDIDLPALLGHEVNVNSLLLADLNTHIKRSLPDSTFNFNFFIKAFAGDPVSKPEKKDTAASPWQISADKIELRQIRASFVDDVSGNDMRASIGQLELSMKQMDLRAMQFDGDELSLGNTSVSIIRTKSSPAQAPDTTTTKLPGLSMNRIDLDQVQFYFADKTSGVLLQADVGHLITKPDVIDLNGQQVKVHELELEQTISMVAIRSNKDTTVTNKPAPTISQTIAANTGWKASAERVLMNEVDFRFDITNQPRVPYGMDYGHMYFSHVKMDLRDASYSPERSIANIRHISLKEQCGIDLRKLSAQAEYDDRHAELSNLTLVTSRSYISNYLQTSYTSVKGIGKDVGALGLRGNLRNTKVSLKEVLLFAPMLKDMPPFKGPDRMVEVNGRINGKLKDIYAENIVVRTAQATAVALDAHIKGLPDAMNAVYDIHLRSLVTTKADVLALSPVKLPVAIPANVLLKGNFKGSFMHFIADLVLQSSAGEAQVNAKMDKIGNDTAYAATVQLKALDLGYLLSQPATLGTVTMKASLEGQNFQPERMKAGLVSEIREITLNRYPYRNIALSADANKQQYAAAVLVNDTNIVMNVQATASLIPKQEALIVDLNLEGADLHELKLTQSAIRTSGKLNIDLKGKSIEDLNGRASLNKVLIIKNDKKYRVDSFLVATVNDTKHSSLKMKSGFINVDYDGTLTLSNLGAAMIHHIDRYFNITKDPAIERKDTSEQDFKLAVKVLPNPILNEVFLTSLEKFNGADVAADFNNTRQQLNVLVNVPVVQYSGIKINDLHAEVHSGNESMNYDFSVTSLKDGNIYLSKTSLSGKLQDNAINFSMSVIHPDSGNKLLASGNVKQERDEEYALHLDHDLVFNNRKWQLPENNTVVFKGGGLYVHDFVLSSEGESITAASSGNNESSPLKVTFKQFDLGTISQVVERDTAIVRGILNGTLELRNLPKAPAFVSDLKIDSIVFMQNSIGNLDIQADNLSANKYTAHIALRGNDNNVQIDAWYAAADKATMDIKANIQQLQIRSIEGFTAGQIRRSSGYIAGDVHITGNTSQPQFNGDVAFHDAAFNVAYINNYISVQNEHIRIDPKGVYFNNFTVRDSAGQKADINGTVYTADFTKMKFDLTVKMNKFTVLNTTIRDNPLYFGRVLLSSNIRITGNESLPVVNMDATLLSGSAITVVVPSSQLSTDKGDGVVVLIDTSKTRTIMTRIDTVPMITSMRGIDLNANIEISKQTKFKVIVDRVSGDSLVVKGEGTLSFSLDPSGKQSLTGTYVLDDGSYNASFQKVIKRDFRIKPGSSITWGGSPTDATVDITAIYRTRTSPADLLATELTGASTAERNAYRKLLVFNVNMMMKGPLLRPEISFMIDMLDKDKGAFSGMVYSKIESLNNEPEELNKQVFSLLVLNKFVPSGTAENSGDAGAVNTIARNSVNQVLSDQLNQLSGKYIKDVELNFDIQSNDEYTATSVQQNTEVQVGLKKEFFNNRVSVQVGSNINVQDNGATPTNASNLTGDAVVEYKITDDGRYRFKAFRENQYEGIIDGLLYVTGVGVIYTRDYDTLHELFSPPKKEKEPEIEEEKK